MKIEPLPKELFDKLVAAELTSVTLEFSGGNDEGYLNVAFVPEPQHTDRSLDPLTAEVEDWVWEVYEYSGAGGGNDYGDNITYNLADMTAAHQGWYMEVKYDEESEPEAFAPV